MRRIESLRSRVFIIILNLVVVSLATGESITTVIPPSSYGGLTFRLVEDRAHIQQAIPADKKIQVDLRSTLFILFEPPQASGESDKRSPDWEVAHKLLELVNDLAKRYADLNSESIDLSDSKAVAQFQRRVKDFGDPAVDALIKASKLAANSGLDEAEFVKLLNGDTKKRGYKPDRVYENLALFLKEHIEDLHEEAWRFRQEKDGYELTVIALHKQAGGGTSRIHVDEYDNLPGGDPEAPRPLERYGIRMTPKELRRFRMEVEASQKTADLIREIKENRDKIRSRFKQLGKQLEIKLEQLLKEFVPENSELANWQAALDSAMIKLKDLKKNSSTPDDVKTASGNLIETLNAVQNDLANAVEVVALIKRVQDQLTNGQTTDLFKVISGEDGVLITLNELASNVNKLDEARKDYRKHIDTFTKNASIIGGEIAKISVVNEVRDYLEDLPKTVEFVSFVDEFMSSKSDQMVEAADTLADVADPIYYDIKDPPTATIDLDQYRNMERKDGIIVKVMFRAKGTEGLDGIEHIESYYLELEKLDEHTSVSASLIFARASSGTQQAKEWAPNVAAMVNWHKRNRKPLNGEMKEWDKRWNWLNPGAGVHLASLDQGDDTVEFGVGANLSFWNGLLNLGYGFNLSQPEDREYFFVGLNLLHLLDVARGTASTPSWERGIDFR
jgi:hypothetical protein